MLSRKLLSIFLAVVLILSCGVSAFADSSQTEQVTAVEGNDITIQYDDYGIYEMISNIDDPIKQEMIMDYWYTPAFYTTTPIDMQNQRALKEGVRTIKGLINTPTNELESAINQLLQKDIDRFAKDSNIKILPSFHKSMKKNTVLKNVDKLESKVGYEKGINLNVATQAVNSEVINSLAAATSQTTTTTANYTVGNAGNFGYLMINCKVVWIRDTTTYDITSFLPTTTTGYFAPTSAVGPYDKSEQAVVSGSIDRAYVHKGTPVYTAATYVPSSYLVVDILVNGNGTISKKYAGSQTVQLYPRYSWSN